MISKVQYDYHYKNTQNIELTKLLILIDFPDYSTFMYIHRKIYSLLELDNKQKEKKEIETFERDEGNLSFT